MVVVGPFIAARPREAYREVGAGAVVSVRAPPLPRATQAPFPRKNWLGRWRSLGSSRRGRGQPPTQRCGKEVTRGYTAVPRPSDPCESPEPGEASP